MKVRLRDLNWTSERWNKKIQISVNKTTVLQRKGKWEMGLQGEYRYPSEHTEKPYFQQMEERRHKMQIPVPEIQLQQPPSQKKIMSIHKSEKWQGNTHFILFTWRGW